jgi:DNA-binding transcriptional ArsR family regulator
MTPDYYRGEKEPEMANVFAVLNDEQSLEILRTLQDRSLTAKELNREVSVPMSSLYRKLDMLVDAGLLETNIEIRPAGKNANRYSVAMDSITIDFTGRSLDVGVSEPIPAE